MVEIDRKDVILEALRHPNPAYALGQRLRELYPDRAIASGDRDSYIQVFARDGHCTFEPRGEVYAHYDTSWTPERGISRRGTIGWWTCTWDGTELDVYLAAWPSRTYGDTERYFVVGPSLDRVHAFIAAALRWSHEVRGEVLVFSNGCFTKSQPMHHAIASSTFDQLVLNGTLKQQIRDDFAQFLTMRGAYESAGVPWKRGALLVGPPGNGKTLCVKALVNELAIPCLYVQSFAPREYMTAQQCIDLVFTRARATTPCILVLEDIDALLVDGTGSFFLNALDGFAANAGIVTLATTNHPERLDSSIIDRPSRFDRKYHFDLPDPAARAEYISSRNTRTHATLRLSDTDCTRLAELTDEFSFAYLQELFVSSMMRFMAAPAGTPFVDVAVEQVGLLRTQLKTVPAAEALPPPEPRRRPRPTF